MPWVALIVGVLLIIMGVTGRYNDLASQVHSDFTGHGSFVDWIAALIIIGAIGYLPGMKGPSTAFLILLILAFILSNNGVFANLKEAVVK